MLISDNVYYLQWERWLVMYLRYSLPSHKPYGNITQFPVP
jgi:hypothetical protein